MSIVQSLVYHGSSAAATTGPLLLFCLWHGPFVSNLQCLWKHSIYRTTQYRGYTPLQKGHSMTEYDASHFQQTKTDEHSSTGCFEHPPKIPKRFNPKPKTQHPQALNPKR